MMTGNLLKQGIAAVKAGRKAEARKLLTQVIEQDERNEMAWLWLSGAVGADEDRRICLENVLAINPNNSVAKQGLASLTAKQGLRSLSTTFLFTPSDGPVVTSHKESSHSAKPGGVPNVTQHKRGAVAKEATYFSGSGVTITSKRAVFRSKTYAMRHITSVQMVRIKANKTVAVIVILLGVVAGLLAMSGEYDSLCWGVAILLLIVGIAAYAARRDEHAVRIGVSSGESDALVSTDKELIQRVVVVIRQAITERD